MVPRVRTAAEPLARPSWTLPAASLAAVSAEAARLARRNRQLVPRPSKRIPLKVVAAVVLPYSDIGTVSPSKVSPNVPPTGRLVPSAVDGLDAAVLAEIFSVTLAFMQI